MKKRKAVGDQPVAPAAPVPRQPVPATGEQAGPTPVEAFMPQPGAVASAGAVDEARRLKEMAHTLRNMGRYLEAMSLVMEGIRLYPEYTDLYFLFGTLNMDLGQVREAEQAFQACLTKGEAALPYATTQGVGSFLAHYNLGMIYEMTGAPERAATHYCEAARAGYAPAGVRARLLGKVCRMG